MFIVDGTFKGQSIPEGTCFIMTKEYGSTDKSLYSGKYGYVNLRNNIISADVVSQESATGGGVQGAASGAVLGFLIAGPVGTVLGAGLGSKKKGMDNVMIAITFANGDSWVVDRVEPKELGALKRYSASTIVRQPKKISSSSTKRKTVTKKRTTQLTIKKPKKPPTWDFDLKRVKGRKSSDKSKLPELPFLSKWKNIDGCDEKATKIFNINLSNEVQKYNNFKWIYFDRKIIFKNNLVERTL